MNATVGNASEAWGNATTEAPRDFSYYDETKAVFFVFVPVAILSLIVIPAVLMFLKDKFENWDGMRQQGISGIPLELQGGGGGGTIETPLMTGVGPTEGQVIGKQTVTATGQAETPAVLDQPSATEKLMGELESKLPLP